MKRRSLYLSDELAERYDAIAESGQVSFSEAVRQTLLLADQFDFSRIDRTLDRLERFLDRENIA